MLTAFSATYYDGKSSRAHDVQVQLDPDTERLSVRGADVGSLHFTLDSINIAPRVGDTPRFIYLTQGASLETGDNDAVDTLVPALPGGRFHLAQHHVESKLRWIIAMLALTIAFGWATIEYGVPYMAKKVAFALPRDVDEQLGNGVLAALDEFIFEPSTLNALDQERLHDGFDRMVGLSDLNPNDVQLEFRASPVMGANALALPSGIIVMTDELVAMAADGEEVQAVLAHEIGHIRHRHSLRGVLQNSTVALAIAGLTGDLASLTSISATIPTLIVQLKYSRGFELEADDYAVLMMNDMGIDPSKLGDVLLRMTSEFEGEAESDEISDYLSTHPGSAGRMQRILEGMGH
ncbi:MAG: M48 family metallopeptidase [Geminicoccaceae bacterium]